ncbi:hypothetical protein COT70_01385 [candidate division WWE3 bacterium CG09_land_8_20_14_0_10_47_33]|uniref:Uncharacterized protein n=1 Tax=candidate division WWE3 bacterium CG_4_9_14_0_2_um_filter_48_10 TaxID=1975078 RepID=A0A2M8EJQ6_UNCKA|nr:MAG: hypothetical protein COT70_01385 [candidate division WWE3 bacterium CG09_land_8_20_14_0_10_47_33]PIZ41456.1 MAG: hypothetical protein COY35_00385 [candidate division WWE3 bacterium CG_4_10_14_0_2_um_filter_47_8]PJC22964.1 MAG: hypothetical protein CO059_01110 [candidate division WWE3 bacterium CG_4_9_14_0_2_um_filter_48_10]PJE51206.1 MAG: hypothetical protein COV28_02550 [candidate division WWE3 bacterium CG10_big_fil_rev_8_21_14_0_10_48_23]
MAELSEKELLERDRKYLERAANVADWERELIEEGLSQGKRLLPDYLSPDQEIYCPVWRLRLYILQQIRYQTVHSPVDVVRRMIWGLDHQLERVKEMAPSDRRKEYTYRVFKKGRKQGRYQVALVTIPVSW